MESVMDGAEKVTLSTVWFGDTRSGDVPTDVKFTGQRLDSGTGLYYYNARYYDPLIGRFISADTIIPDPMNPQAFNRYTYCLNNPLKYVDPSGHILYTSEGMTVEEVDTILWATALLAIYGHTVDINIGKLMTKEYMFVNDLRILESKGEIESGTVDRYIKDEQEWITRSTKNDGFEIVEKLNVGPGGYFNFGVTYIVGVGGTAGLIYDSNGWHPYIGIGFGFEIGGGVTTSACQLVPGMNYEYSASLLFYQHQGGYSAYTDDYYLQHGLQWSRIDYGLSVKAYYIGNRN